LARDGDGVSASRLRLLGLDVGDRRIGVAVSDPTGSIATPIEVYQRHGWQRDVAHLVRLAQDLEVSGIIVGLPMNMNGTEGPQAEKTRDFARALTEVGLDVRLWDERLSSVEATRRLIQAGKRRRKLRERLDSEAAALILETYLDHVRTKEVQ
jgi:putative holliday junction resolvase